MPTVTKPTLCWDCKKSTTKECSWAEKLEPVDGWEAIPCNKKEFDSFSVIRCPEFQRNSFEGGAYKPEEYQEALRKRKLRREGKK